MLFFYLIISFVGKIGWFFQQLKMDRDSFKHTYNPIDKTYMDWRGTTRSEYGEPIYVRKNENGHFVKINTKQEIKQDYTQEKINSVFSNPELTVKQIEIQKYRDKYNEPIGTRYQDKKTGAIYVIRTFRIPTYGVSFYMDVNNLHLIRMIEGEEEFCKNNYININEVKRFIRDFNLKQDKNNYRFKWEKFYNNNVGHHKKEIRT